VISQITLQPISRRRWQPQESLQSRFPRRFCASTRSLLDNPVAYGFLPTQFTALPITANACQLWKCLPPRIRCRLVRGACCVLRAACCAYGHGEPAGFIQYRLAGTLAGYARAASTAAPSPVADHAQDQAQSPRYPGAKPKMHQQGHGPPRWRLGLDPQSWAGASSSPEEPALEPRQAPATELASSASSWR